MISQGVVRNFLTENNLKTYLKLIINARW